MQTKLKEMTELNFLKTFESRVKYKNIDVRIWQKYFDSKLIFSFGKVLKKNSKNLIIINNGMFY